MSYCRTTTWSVTLISTLLSTLITTVHAKTTESPDMWYQQGQQSLRQAIALKPNTHHAKNIILFVGDGMGISTVTAGRIFDGQSKGQAGEENQLSFEKLPYVGLAKTYNTNQQTPDSAGTMTAMMTGVKTRAGYISTDQVPDRGDCTPAQGHGLKTLLEQAEQAGMATGVVTTARLTHATPAATYAHVTERDWESDDEMSKKVRRQGCKDIARQLLEFPYGDGLEVAFGGGWRHFIPETERDLINHSQRGRREDGRNLITEWLDRYPRKGAFVWNKAQLSQLDDDKQHVLGLFNRSHMSFHTDQETGNPSGEPTLKMMTQKALNILHKRPQGFFLMVENGRIDHGHHAGNAYRALHETQAFADSIQAALSMVDLKDTLVIVTADHSHVLTMAGYPTRGNPILGKVHGNDSKGNPRNKNTLADDDLPYTTLGYMNGPGSVGNRDRDDLTSVDTSDSNFQQQALIPTSAETHSGEDVAIYAGGPWAHLIHGAHEQNYIYHVMYHAAQLNRARH
ncbi:alkaline phosphatase [Zooshikella harenae]|uniref:Alkaline phosphatase n=1 Tax=Zooshikella harenae TaxID=2827238 RepID=A0ABS5ZH63_9GAMM|nr:alkaline phosphatase [Zooshikella harenae]MBU2713300.1 alkaline phosphatase [Zooshikella harenae]